MGRLARNRRVETVTGEHEGLGGKREQPAIDRLDDRVEVGILERGVSRATGEERVAAETDRVTLEQEAGGPRRVTGRVDRLEPQVADRSRRTRSKML